MWQVGDFLSFLNPVSLLMSLAADAASAKARAAHVAEASTEAHAAWAPPLQPPLSAAQPSAPQLMVHAMAPQHQPSSTAECREERRIRSAIGRG